MVGFSSNSAKCAWALDKQPSHSLMSNGCGLTSLARLKAARKLSTSGTLHTVQIHPICSQLCHPSVSLVVDLRMGVCLHDWACRGLETRRNLLWNLMRLLRSPSGTSAAWWTTNWRRKRTHTHTRLSRAFLLHHSPPLVDRDCPCQNRQKHRSSYAWALGALPVPTRRNGFELWRARQARWRRRSRLGQRRRSEFFPGPVH